MLELSQRIKQVENGTTWLTKRFYPVSQGLVDDLLANVASLNAQISSEDLSMVTSLAEASFSTMSPLSVEYRIQHASQGERSLSANFMPVVQENGSIQWHGFIKEITEHNKTANVLEHLYKALDSMADPVFIKDREHRWMFLNDACCQIFGYNRDELIGKTDFDFFPKHEAKVFWEKDEQVFSSGQENINEENLTDKNGNKQTILTKKTRYTDSHGQYFLIGIISNITEHKQAQVEKQRFLTILEETIDFVGSADLQGNLLYHNRAALNMIGLPEDFDLSAMHISDIYPAWATKIVQEVAIPTALEQGVWRGETALLHRDGREIPVSQLVVVHRGADGQPEFISTVMQDISERKKVEALLADRERGFRAMIENAPDNIVRYDRDLRMLYVNPVMEKTFGQPAENLIGRRVDEIVPDNLKTGEYHAVMRQVLETGQAAEYLMVGEPGGYSRTVYDSIRIVPEFAADGSIQGILAIGRDLSSTRELEMAIAEQARELHTLIANTPDIIVRYDRDCRRTWISANYEAISNNPVSAALGTKPTEYWGNPSMSPEVFEHLLREVMTSGEPRDIELDWTAPDGEYVCQSLRVVPEYAANGEICSALSFARDVSELKRAGRRIQDSEQEFRTLIEHSPNITVRYDREFRRVFVNPAYEQITGVRTIDALGEALSDSWVPENISSEAYKARLQHVMDSGEPTNVILEWTEPGGLLVSHDMLVVPEYGINGQLKGTLVIGHNISRLRRAEIVLTKREQEFRALVEHSPDTITRYDRDCRRIYANPRMQVESCVPLDELMYKTPEEFPGGEQASAYQERIHQVLSSGLASQFELAWRTRNSNEMCSHIHLTPEFDAEGNVVSVLAVGRDITEIDAYRKQIHNLAFFDTLTNLPNRSLLNDRIHQTVADAARRQYQFGLMMMDLDRFKEINDTLGHSVGDQVLSEVARRLSHRVRSSDTVARLGGDEFALLLPETQASTDLSNIAHKILGAFNEPLIIDGRELFISGSIGIALYPHDSTDVETLFRYADSAMYHAKQQGRNNFQFYSAELTEKTAGRMAIENDLRKAQERNEFELYYQPQIELATGQIIGAEALLRWNHSKQGIITPDKFIPIAEETGLIIGIGEWVLRTACQAAVAWNSVRATPLCIAVNLSTRQFLRNDLVGTVQRILTETACPASWIKLEITESLLLEDSQEIAAMLETFNNMGHIISIDDFGTGYSALSYLNRFPVNQIKIDRSFVQDIPHDHNKTELVKVMISISQVLNMELVAEGVETQAQANCLLTNGCAMVQGYLFGKPMQYAAFENMVAKDDRELHEVLPVFAISY